MKEDRGASAAAQAEVGSPYAPSECEYCVTAVEARQAQPRRIETLGGRLDSGLTDA